jgi:hypothetical protein
MKIYDQKFKKLNEDLKHMKKLIKKIKYQISRMISQGILSIEYELTQLMENLQ